jgi:hypothetical protein
MRVVSQTNKGKQLTLMEWDMTLPPQGHPQYELRRRIADCRERLRRSRTGQRQAEHEADAQMSAAHDEPPNEDATDAPTRRRTIRIRRAR